MDTKIQAERDRLIKRIYRLVSRRFVVFRKLRVSRLNHMVGCIDYMSQKYFESK